MYHKAKNSLASLAIAVTMLGVSYSIGGAPIQVAQAAPKVELEAASIEAGLENLSAERKRVRSMQGQLSMPFYSFATLLPKRES
jgi:hypothetical protein